MSHGAEGKQFAVANDRRGGGTSAIRSERPLGITRGIPVHPESFPGRFLKTKHALEGIRRDQFDIRQINSPADHNGTGKAPSDRNTPRKLQAFLWEGLQNTKLLPYRVAIQSSPLRPVVRPHARGSG